MVPWKELFEKFRELSRFLRRECELMPDVLFGKLLRKRLTRGIFFGIPLSLKDGVGRIHSANLNLYYEYEKNEHGGYRVGILPAFSWWKKWRDGFREDYHYVHEWIVFKPGAFCSHSSLEDLTECLGKYFTQLNKNRDTIYFHHTEVLGVLTTAYLQLCKFVEDFFEEAKNQSSFLDAWRNNRKLFRARAGLKKIVETCEASRKTVGKSNTLACIRECATEASAEYNKTAYAPWGAPLALP